MDEFNSPFLGKIQRPHFCKEAINIGEFCSSFSKEIDEVLPYKGTEWVTLQESMDMSFAAVKEVAEICSVDHLTCEGEPSPDEEPSLNQLDTGLESKCSFPNISADLSGGWGETIDDQAASKLKSLRFQRRKASSLNRSFNKSRSLYKNLRYPFEIRLEADSVQKALNSRRIYMKSLSALEGTVSVRLYRSPKLTPTNPMSQNRNFGSHRVFSLTQEVLCLGSNRLTDLRDEIRCPNDELVTNDCSQTPAGTRPITAKEKYPSGFFCIDSVFHVDDRDSKSIDYSEPIREWAAERGVKDLKQGSMKDVCLQDLTVRLGYPYIYVHQGRCQHLVVFSDVRLFRPGFDVSTHSYPRTVAIRRDRTQLCHLCERVTARWLTMDHELTPTNPTLFCGDCFHQFNYRRRNQPMCRFKAYPLRPGPWFGSGTNNLDAEPRAEQGNE